MQILKTTSVLLTLGTAAAADVPNVVTDIAPIQSIVAGVMGDLGQPTMIVDANQDAHNFSLRPSQARQLQDADVIIWVGESLLPFLPDTFASLASSVSPLALIDVISEDKLLDWDDEHHDGHDDHDDHEEEGHDDHDEEGHDDHAEDDHDDHKDEDHADHDDHGDEDGHDDHDHAGHDPHIWLDPSLMIDVVPAIAETLSAADPENAATYAANAQTVIADMNALKPEISGILTQQTRPILALHDSLGYYEIAFPAIEVLAIPESDGSNNSLDDAALLEQLIADEKPACAMIEPFAENAGLSVLSERNGVPLASMDVMGRDFDMGADRYRNMMIALAITIASCGE
ncbi:MAG: metal ABC transporter solute-binding protein, Zn/Mn family [Planktomarina sp.]